MVSPMRTFVLVAALLAPALAVADPAALKLAAARTSLLSDHLTVTLPVGMTLAPPVTQQLFTESSGDGETRAVLDDGKARFTVACHEAYALAGNDVKAHAEAAAKRRGVTTPLEVVALPKPLLGVAIAPPVTGDRDSNLVYDVYIASGDGTLQFISFYVNRDGAAQGAAWAALAKKIVATLAPGKRVLAKRGDRKLSNDLTITVPDGWFTFVDPTPGLASTRMKQLVVFGQAPPSCMIYVGDPAAIELSQPPADAKTTKSAGKLFGAKAEWASWSEGREFWSRVNVKHPNGADAITAGCSSTLEADLAKMRRIVESLRKS